MSITQTRIYNIALNNLGISQRIQNINQPDVRTATLNNFYDIALEQVLTDFDWGFASTIRDLASTGNHPENPEYLFEYDYPNDCLAIREVFSTDKYKITTNFNGGRKVILCNISNAKIRYTRRVENESDFPADFIMALAWYLSFLSAPALVGGTNKRNEAYQIYQGMKRSAKNADVNEHSGIEEDIPEWFKVL